MAIAAFDPTKFVRHSETPLLIGGVGQGDLTAEVIRRFGTSFKRCPKGKLHGSFYVRDADNMWVVVYNQEQDVLVFHSLSWESFKAYAMAEVGSPLDVEGKRVCLPQEVNPKFKYLGIQILETIRRFETA